MEEKLIVVVSEHRLFGFLLIPWLSAKSKNASFNSLIRRVNKTDLNENEKEFTDAEINVINILDDISDHSITKIFGRKKNQKEFFQELTPAYVELHIRPYIEKRLEKAIEFITRGNIPLYHKLLTENIHEADAIYFSREPAKTVFNFIKTETDTRYFLSILHNGKTINLFGKNGIVLSNSPCIIVLGNQLLSFTDIDAKKLQPFFTKEHITISKSAEKSYYEKFIAKAIQNYKINYAGFKIIDSEVKHKAVLSLENTLSGIPVLMLYYLYNKKKYHAFSESESVVSLEIKDDEFIFTRSGRNYDWEKDILQLITNWGLKHYENAAFLPAQIDLSDKDNLLFSIINWLNGNIHRKPGVIDLEQGYFKEKYYTGKVDLKILLPNELTDWFDMQAIVTIGDLQIPFIRFKQHILNHRREYTLPDGNVVILPKAWFARYRELFLFSKQSTNDSFKVSICHLPLILETAEHLEKKLDDKLLSLLEKNDFVPEVIPDQISATLRPYQHIGFSWMYKLTQHGLGVCLADDMGLGKTLQTITLISKALLNEKPIFNVVQPKTTEQLNLFQEIEKKNTIQSKTSLIVMPASLIHNWHNELEKFAPHLKVYKYTGPTREYNPSLFAQYDIVLTTYGMVRMDSPLLSKYNFLFIILDESQTIKNAESQNYKAVKTLKSRYKITLTGTPVENSLTDLWSQLNFLNDGMLGSLTFFKKEFATPIEKANDENKQEKLKKMIEPFILRRKKQDVALDLPELMENSIYCDMTTEQQDYYEEEKSKVRNYLLDNITSNGIEKSSIAILQALMKLRQIANHPVISDSTYAFESGKFNEVTRNLQNINDEGHKVIIFSSFVKHLNLFETFFNEQQFAYSKLTGATKNREEMVRSFQENENNRFFLISMKAGGTGLNLTAADYVFILDPWWNPAVESQAIARAHRIGQRNNVIASKFISSNTIEEKIIKLQQKKQLLADKFINVNNPLNMLSENEIMGLFE